MGNFRLRDIGILSQTQGAAFPSGATHYWKFENGNDSIGTINLNASGTITYVAGKNNNAAKYAGTSYLYNNSVNTNYTGAGTLSFWLYPTSAGNQQILDCTSNQGHNLQIYGSKLYWRIYETDTWTISTNKLGTGAWKFVVIQWNGTARKMWINNNSEANTTKSATAPNNNKLWVGATNSGAYPLAANTLLDEMAIWNRALTQTEITNLYNSGTGLFY